MPESICRRWKDLELKDDEKEVGEMMMRKGLERSGDVIFGCGCFISPLRLF